jgi:hypothetical protein
MLIYGNSAAIRPHRRHQHRRGNSSASNPPAPTFAVNASPNLEAIADAFDAELYADLLEREGGRGRGLAASHASRTSPRLVVPLASALIVTDPAIPAGQQYVLGNLNPMATALPLELQALMSGAIPQACAMAGLPFVQLAAALLWLKSSKAINAQPPSNGAQLHKAWQQYINQVGCHPGNNRANALQGCFRLSRFPSLNCFWCTWAATQAV